MTRRSMVPDFAQALTERRSELKRDAAKRLLKWGFAPGDISILTGCDEAWIRQYNEEQLRSPRQQ